ncbi:MAG: hypothetical protein IMZ50_00195 [Candidatus Atribacteria bacterium]|nr:hypothetical protein [Candidatus Atribacteria bacterium]
MVDQTEQWLCAAQANIDQVAEAARSKPTVPDSCGYTGCTYFSTSAEEHCGAETILQMIAIDCPYARQHEAARRESQ